METYDDSAPKTHRWLFCADSLEEYYAGVFVDTVAENLEPRYDNKGRLMSFEEELAELVKEKAKDEVFTKT